MPAAAAGQKCMWSWKTPPRSGALNSSATLADRSTLHAARSTPEQATKLERTQWRGRMRGGKTRLRTRICSKHGHRYYKYTMRTHCQIEEACGEGEGGNGWTDGLSHECAQKERGRETRRGN